MPDPYAELGEIVTGKKPGRETEKERIIDFNFGMAIHDVLMASKVLVKAKKKNLGTMLPLIEGPLPFA